MQEPLRILNTKKSRQGLIRGLVWLVAIPFLGLAIFNYNAAGTMFVVLMTLTLALLFDYALRKQVKPGEEMVRVDDSVIASPFFSDGTKQYKLSDIASVAVDQLGHTRVLRLALHPEPAHGNKGQFWRRFRTSKPVMSMQLLSEVEQELLVGVLHQRLHSGSGIHVAPSAAPGNVLSAQRELDERLAWMKIFPLVTVTLITLNVLMWLLTLAMGASVRGTAPEQLLAWGGNAASEVQRGEYLRLFSSMFLHNGFKHLFMNMLSLAIFGCVAERHYGHRQFLLIYLASGLAGSGLSLHFSAQQGVSVGASGAVFGVLVAYVIGTLISRKQVSAIPDKNLPTRLGFIVVYSLLLGFADKHVDNAAHLGGVIAGLLLALWLPVRVKQDQFRAQSAKRTTYGAIAAAIMLSALVFSAPAAQLDLKKIQLGQAAFVSGMTTIQEALKETAALHAAHAAGKLSEQELEEKSRSVLLPKLRKGQADLAVADLRPEDQRRPMLLMGRRMVELFIEMIEMPSVPGSKPGTQVPADPKRMKEIETEIRQLEQQASALARQLQAQQ